MSEINESLEVEELSTEEKKKAINLQDLVYVKKYVDKGITDAIEKQVPEIVADAVKEGYYTQTETDAKFYKKTDTVANANHAVSADNATQAMNANHATTADRATNADTANLAGNAETANSAAEATHAVSADSASTATNADYATNAGHATNATHAESADNATEATHAMNADQAVNATHADSADSATNATNAVNAVLKTDGSYVGLTLDENEVLKRNDGATLNAENAVNATYAERAGTAETVAYAESAAHADTAGYADTAGEVSNALHATTADNATNAVNAVLKPDGTYIGLTMDENGVLRVGGVVMPHKKLLCENLSMAAQETTLLYQFSQSRKDLNYLNGRKFEIEIQWYGSFKVVCDFGSSPNLASYCIPYYTASTTGDGTHGTTYFYVRLEENDEGLAYLAINNLWIQSLEIIRVYEIFE